MDAKPRNAVNDLLYILRLDRQQAKRDERVSLDSPCNWEMGFSAFGLLNFESPASAVAGVLASRGPASRPQDGHAVLCGTMLR
jgi:hypothetical protein